jgi:hypothetical protein
MAASGAVDAAAGDIRIRAASSTRRPAPRRVRNARTLRKRRGRNRTRKADQRMSRFFRLQVNPNELVDAMFAFVTDPQPSRNERPIVQELHDVHPESVEVMESMLLDGTENRQDVADYVEAVFGGRFG